MLKLISPYLKSLLDEIVGAERGKDFIALISFVIISGSIVKGIEGGKVFSALLLRKNLIRILSNYLNLTLNVIGSSLSFFILVVSVVLLAVFLGNLIIQRKKTI